MADDNKITLYVALDDRTQFDSKAEQDELAEKIDRETFVAPSFVGTRSRTDDQVTVRTQVTTLNTEAANQIGQIVADHFDTSFKRVQFE